MGNVKKENHTIVRKVKLKVNHCLVGMKSQNLVLASQLKFPQILETPHIFPADYTKEFIGLFQL
jgi:hypothetical protein